MSVSDEGPATRGRFDFALPDASAGGEVRRAGDVAGGSEYLLAVLLGDHYCPRCRVLVRDLADGHGAFLDRSTAVAAVLPDRLERAAVWHRRYDLPFPILADPGPEGAGEARFDAFDRYHRRLGRLPGVVLFDVAAGRLRPVRTWDGGPDGTVPSAAGLLSAVEETDGPGRPGVESGA